MKRRSGFGNTFLDPRSGIGEYDESSGVAGFVAARDPPQKLAHRGASRRPRAEEDCLPVGYGPVILRANHVERESRELPEEAFRRFDGRRAGDYLLFPGERQLPTGPGEDPPSQPALEGMETDLPHIDQQTGEIHGYRQELERRGQQRLSIEDEQ